jgi:hypothetical protein
MNIKIIVDGKKYFLCRTCRIYKKTKLNGKVKYFNQCNSCSAK